MMAASSIKSGVTRVSVVIACAAMGSTVLALAPAAPATASPAILELGRVDPLKRVGVGERAEDTITVTPDVSAVILQQPDSAGRWQTLWQLRTKGRRSLTVTYPRAVLGPQRFRVVPLSKEPPAYGAPVVATVVGFQPQATLSGWTAEQEFARKGSRQVRTLQASPPGAMAQIERRRTTGGKWRVADTMKVRANGRLRVNPGRVVQGTTRYRVVIPRQDIVGTKLVSEVRTVIGYGRVPPTPMLPDLLNRTVARLGIPAVSSSSVGNPDTARAACVAAELAGLGASRAQPGPRLRARLLSTRSFTRAPAGIVDGINVSVRCQAAYFVRGGRVLRAVPVSTGRSGYRTNLGTYRIFRGVNGVETSNEFPDDHWNMYRSLYFNGGEAVHGSYSDSYVRTYPDSHGCVRMLHRDVDWLWRNGWTIGTTVRVYGSY